MARPLRIEFPGALYHITARGNAGQDIFLDARDSQRFLDLLGEVATRCRWRCYAYCLMTNHYHLSYCQKLCMGGSCGGAILAFSIYEFDAANDLGEMVRSIEFSPFSLSALA